MQDAVLIRRNGEKVLAFDRTEYDTRLEGLRDLLNLHGLDAVVLTSVHGVGYYGGLLPAPLGRAQALVVTGTDAVVVTAAFAGNAAVRSSPFDAVLHDDDGRDRFWRAVASVTGTARAVGVEADHLTMVQADMMNHFLRPRRGMDVAPATRMQRLVKSDAELGLIETGAEIAQSAVAAMRDALRVGLRGHDLLRIGAGVLDAQTARHFPDAAPGAGQVWVQSGPDTDGICAAPSSRKIRDGDPVTLTCVAMVAGYGVPVTRSFIAGTGPAGLVDRWTQLADHQQTVLAGVRPGQSCADLASLLGQHADSPGGYGHSVGFSGLPGLREAGLDLRADNDTALETGMVLSLGALRPAASGGLRCSDVVILTADGADVLTDLSRCPDTLPA